MLRRKSGNKMQFIMNRDEISDVKEKKLKGRNAKSQQTINSFLPKIIKLMKVGASLTEISALIGVTRQSMYYWLKSKDEKYAKLQECVKLGLQLSESWWEKQGRLNIKSKQFNSVLWLMNMSNRFGWASSRQQIQQESTTKTEVKIEKLDSVIDAIIDKDNK